MKRDRANCDIRESISDARAVRARFFTKVRENLRSSLRSSEKKGCRRYGFEYNSKALSSRLRAKPLGIGLRVTDAITRRGLIRKSHCD
jgi:hypothetical protein